MIWTSKGRQIAHQKYKIFIPRKVDKNKHYNLITDDMLRTLLDNATENQSGVLQASMDFGYIIGQARIVKAPQASLSEVVYLAERRTTGIMSRVIRAEKVPDTSFASMVADHSREGVFKLRDIYAGKFCAPDMWDFESIKRGGYKLSHIADYWSRNAYVYSYRDFGSIPAPGTLNDLIKIGLQTFGEKYEPMVSEMIQPA